MRTRFTPFQRWAPLAIVAIALVLILCGCSSIGPSNSPAFTSIYSGRIDAFGFGVANVIKEKP